MDDLTAFFSPGKRWFAGHPGRIHRIYRRIEDNEIEMPDKNGQGRQNCLEEMQDGGSLGYPTGEIRQCEVLEPQHEPGNSGDQGAPQRCPIFDLLYVTEANRRRWIITTPKVIADAVRK